MKNRPLNMDVYGISYNAYMELYHVCQQYREKKVELDGMIEISSSLPRGEVYKTVRAKNGKVLEELRCITPKGQGGTSDPVFDTVVRREKLQRELKQIEQTAIEVAPGMYQELLRAVTSKEGYQAIRPPCGYHQFAEMRRKFFYVLWHKREM